MTYDDNDSEFDEDEEYADEEELSAESLQQELKTTRKLLQTANIELEQAETQFIGNYVRPLHDLLKEGVAENEQTNAEVATCKMLISELKDVTSELDKTEKDVVSANAEISSLNLMNDQVIDDLDTAHIELNQANIELSQLRNAQVHAVAKANEYVRHQDNKRSEYLLTISSLENKVRDLEYKVNDSRSQAYVEAEMRHQVDVVQTEKAFLEKELESLKKQHVFKQVDDSGNETQRRAVGVVATILTGVLLVGSCVAVKSGISYLWNLKSSTTMESK